jgi:choline-glycine betaine transporter
MPELADYPSASGTTPNDIRVESACRSVLILWGVLTGIAGVVLRLAGGLSALQNTVIVASLRRRSRGQAW